jgi:hypothetical protein
MTLRRWVEYTVAILAGNAIYFLVLYPGLPRLLQHQAPRPDAHISPIRLDLGLLIDFLCCVAVYGVIRLGVAHARRWNERSRRLG